MKISGRFRRSPDLHWAKSASFDRCRFLGYRMWQDRVKIWHFFRNKNYLPGLSNRLKYLFNLIREKDFLVSIQKSKIWKIGSSNKSSKILTNLRQMISSIPGILSLLNFRRIWRNHQWIKFLRVEKVKN